MALIWPVNASFKFLFHRDDSEVIHSSPGRCDGIVWTADGCVSGCTAELDEAKSLRIRTKCLGSF